MQAYRLANCWLIRPIARITVVHFARSHSDIVRRGLDPETWRLACLRSRGRQLYVVV
ncbi:uncharacterized protein B0T23DRAFT_357598 [Neurospora hispaniola]|uniref:Uncharacterized protein n=1 Tax=Neurospora hispaniola TaxID=588809 RepID=A0AAJ0I790_9PEZI|nr:hypothetical protein B0T23DRAFT_357598 [Neurospora hispaniola]